MIVIEEYNPQWKQDFEVLKEHLFPFLRDHIQQIEHVGSTAIPGLSAKPVIDLDIILNGATGSLEKVTDRLGSLGYLHAGNMGIEGREAFKRSSAKTPLAKDKRDWCAHHLYVCSPASLALANHLALKRHLLSHPAKVAEYGELKKALAQRFPDDMASYVAGKSKFIAGILKEQGLSEAEVQLIEAQNRVTKR